MAKTKFEKRNISKTSLTISLVLFVFSLFLMNTPGDSVIWYFVMGIFVFSPIFLRPKFYRILGIIALVLSILFCFVDYQAGKRWRQKRFEKINEKDKTSSIKMERKKRQPHLWIAKNKTIGQCPPFLDYSIQVDRSAILWIPGLITFARNDTG